MITHLVSGLDRQLAGPGAWMSWNLTLALVPWVMAVWVFRGRRPTKLHGAVAAVVCVAFLPNAAYVLTDLVHLPRIVRAEPSDTVVLLVVLPLFAGFLTVGFLAYVDTVRRISGWVGNMGRSRWASELCLHAASTVGIYLGRVHQQLGSARSAGRDPRSGRQRRCEAGGAERHARAVLRARWRPVGGDGGGPRARRRGRRLAELI